MVKTKVYVEGGGSRDLNRQCRRAFRIFFDKAGIESANVVVEARGPRGEAYNAFRSDSDRDFRKVLLVDAEAGYGRDSMGASAAKGWVESACGGD